MTIFDGQAPGRVNLIGEHTDYNGGFVLPTVIPQRTRVTLERRQDQRVRVESADLGAAEYELGGEARTGEWHDYVQGVTSVLARAGHRFGGFDARIVSKVPMGSGLSSSAALLVALLRALRAAFAIPIDDVKLAKFAHEAEHDFVGARVGVMDPMAVSLALPGSALFLDTRDLTYRRVKLPEERLELVVIASGVSHRNAQGGYNERRAQCEAAAKQLGVKLLRQLQPHDLPRLETTLEPLLYRRARHVISENDRVLAAVAAIEAGDLPRLGRLFDESHASMRDDYEVSTSEIDLLVQLARETPEVFGARLTGGGFGGSIVIAARAGAGAEIAGAVTRRYAKATRLTPLVLVPPASS